MSLIKHNPSREFNSFFDAFFNNNLTDIVGADDYRSTTPAVNITETEADFNIEVAAPGLSKEQFDVNIEDNTLTISVEDKKENEVNEEKYTRREFSYTSFKRSFNLPNTVEVEHINAKYENGILNLTLPKKEEAKAPAVRRIEIA